MGKGGRGSQANQKQTPLEQKKQQNNNKGKDIYVSMLFSAVSNETLNTYQYCEQEVDGKKYASYWFVKGCDPKWEMGSFNESQINKSFFIDCGELVLDFDDECINDPDGMMEIIEETLLQIQFEVMSGLTKKGVKLHFIIAADDIVEDLAYAMNYVFAGKMADKISNSELSDMLKEKYKSYPDRFKNKGITLNVDYTAVTEIKICYVPADPV